MFTVFGLISALLAGPALASQDAGRFDADPLSRYVRVVLDDGSQMLGLGPVRVEVGTVVFRLDHGALVSLPFRRVEMIVPAPAVFAQPSPEAVVRDAARGPGPWIVALGAAQASFGEPLIEITNADLPSLNGIPYLYTPRQGRASDDDDAGRIDEVYFKIRARRLVNELHVAELRIRDNQQQIDGLLRFADKLAQGGRLPVEIDDAITSARMSLESAQFYKEDVKSRWATLQEEARSAGAIIGRLR